MDSLSEKYDYRTIEKSSIAEFKDRGSRFIAYAFPLASKEDFKLQLQWVKLQHPKATHHCFAYRLGLTENEFRVSDDGEPSGSAGRPILGQIDSRELTNVLIFVVRYFGGSLLGVPGLINAYKTAASLALQVTPIVRKQVESTYQLSFDYTIMNDVMMVVKQNQCSVISQDLQLFCEMNIGIPVRIRDEILARFREIPSLQWKKTT
jgi:uncharacterized YigZ family protein